MPQESFGFPYGPHRRHRHVDFGAPFVFGPPFGRGRPGPRGRMPRGNVRAAILLLVKERPMHGYEIISELESRSGGVWRPSPGSVYPTLALLEDEGLVTSTAVNGKRRFSLSDEGAAYLEARGDVPPPWETIADGIDPTETALRESGMLLLGAVGQVGRAGTPAQVLEAVGILDDTRRRLYALLGEPTES